MAVDEDTLLAIDEAILASKETFIFAGTVQTVDPLTVLFPDGAGSGAPCNKLGDVQVTEGSRVVILQVGADFTVIGNYADPAATGANALVGGGTGTYVINHGLNTKRVGVTCYNVSAPSTERYPEIQHTDENNVTLIFENAPASNSVEVSVST